MEEAEKGRRGVTQVATPAAPPPEAHHIVPGLEAEKDAEEDQRKVAAAVVLIVTAGKVGQQLFTFFIYCIKFPYILKC